MKLTLFQAFSIAVLSLFMGVLVFTTVICFIRPSNASWLTTAKLNQVRFEPIADR
jgi:hypothetical protein